MFRSRLLAAALALPCFAGLAAAQSLHTVKHDGTADFLTIQAAVDAAAPGDIVLVLGGANENVLLQRGIMLMSAGGTFIGKATSGPGATLPALRITGLPADELVLLSGFTVFVGSGGAAGAVEVTDCAGAVWLQDVFVDSYGAPSLVADGAASIALHKSFLQTNLLPALPDGTPQPGAGLELRGASRAYGYASDLRGSHGTLVGGNNPVPNAPPDGGAGLLLVDSFAHWSGGSITGGSGNSFFAGSCAFGGNGGDGLEAIDGADEGLPAALLEGTQITAGFGGPFNPACAPPPSPGVTISAAPGVVSSSATPVRQLTLPALGQAGSTVNLGLLGVPGDAALLLVALDAAPGHSAAQVTLHLDLDTLVAVLPFALPAGTLNVPVTLPALPAGVEALAAPLQAVFVDGNGVRHASNPRMLVIR